MAEILTEAMHLPRAEIETPTERYVGHAFAVAFGRAEIRDRDDRPILVVVAPTYWVAEGVWEVRDEQGTWRVTIGRGCGGCGGAHVEQK